MITGSMYYLAAVVIAVVLFVLRWNPRKLPPGPYPFPIIGNIFQLGSKPHQSFAKMAKTYGPLMSLQLGKICAVVVSSPEMAKQALQQHDQALSSRTIITATETHDFHENSMILLPVGSKWRKARKICREHLFSAHRIKGTVGLRCEKVRKMCDYLQECCVAGRAVNVGELAFVTTLNILTSTLFSSDFTNYDSDATQELKETVEGLMKIMGTPNLADFFPLLKWVDPQGIKKQSEICIGNSLRIFGDIINQRMIQSINSPKKHEDLLQVLLDLREESQDNLSINDMKYFFVDLFIGGHTTPTTVEWAMTELLLNPKIMASAKNEMTSVVGAKNQIQESDISRLPYLQALVKETLRLHPPGVLLVPRRANNEVEINGYTIPKNAQIFVNVWGMGRDPSIWPNPTSFEPERFLNSEIDFKGHDFNLIPFGSGRRMCPGVALGDRMLHLMIANLIHNFDWKLEAGVKPEDMDITEKFGIEVQKAVPLVAIPIKAHVNH